jgi:hypothetical protein
VKNSLHFTRFWRLEVERYLFCGFSLNSEWFFIEEGKNVSIALWIFLNFITYVCIGRQPGPNPTTSIYNASGVKIYNTTDS